MGKAVTTKAINNSQLAGSFRDCAIFVYGSYEAGPEKTVEVREFTDRQIGDVLDAYTYDPDFGQNPEDLTLRDDLRTQIATIDANLTTNWSGLDVAGRTAALRAAAILSVRIARFISRRFL